MQVLFDCDYIAKTGHCGFADNNTARDLKRVVLQYVQVPQPYMVTSPLRNNKTGFMKYEDRPVLLTHEVIDYLVSSVHTHRFLLRCMGLLAPTQRWQLSLLLYMLYKVMDQLWDPPEAAKWPKQLAANYAQLSQSDASITCWRVKPKLYMMK